MNGIRPGKTTKTRDKDYESTNISYKLNQSQLLSEIDSDRSQPKSGNDSWRRICCGGQEKGAYFGRLGIIRRCDQEKGTYFGAVWCMGLCHEVVRRTRNGRFGVRDSVKV